MNKVAQNETEETDDVKMLFVQQSILWLGSKFQVLMWFEPLAQLRSGSHARMSRIDQKWSGGVMRLQYGTKSHAGTFLTNMITLCKDAASDGDVGI